MLRGTPINQQNNASTKKLKVVVLISDSLNPVQAGRLK